MSFGRSVCMHIGSMFAPVSPDPESYVPSAKQALTLDLERRVGRNKQVRTTVRMGVRPFCSITQKYLRSPLNPKP